MIIELRDEHPGLVLRFTRAEGETDWITSIVLSHDDLFRLEEVIKLYIRSHRAPVGITRLEEVFDPRVAQARARGLVE